jgi:hypothetical protein
VVEEWLPSSVLGRAKGRRVIVTVFCVGCAAYLQSLFTLLSSLGSLDLDERTTADKKTTP